MMKLFFRELGQGQPFIILHGLMGSSDNWLTQAKLLADQYHLYMIDQRNHGQSSHSDDFDYKVLANDIKDFIQQHKLEKPVVLGHSMGGKAAMNFAISNPDLLDRLIIVDIAPKAYPIHHDNIVEGLKAIPINTLQSRNQADEILSGFVPEVDVRQFLLKNLARKQEGGFAWKINLPVIDKNLELISADIQFPGTFNGQTLFVRGVNSNYVKDEDRARIKALFPNSTLITMDTGHWVQAEKPQEFVEVVRNFLANTKP
ncbi:MAG TPA: alpha/beta fold hydrolase [Cyclobacteriaceae bacterium]|nr:alpha/beta fold hydrolase [Cyclobacteriaceae bacterium]